MTIRESVRRAVAALGVAVLCMSCHATDTLHSVSAPASGTFRLVSINGKPLPDTLLELPTRTGGRSGCFEIAARGWLTLDDIKHSFLVARHLESNCGTVFGGDTTAMGDYRPRGDSLRLMVFNGTDSLQFPASATATQIIIDDVVVQWRYIFER